MKAPQIATMFVSVICFTPAVVMADADADAVAEMARKAQDPLGDVKAIITDNTIGIGGGPEDDTAYGFQVQPVYSITNDTSFNMLARAVIPVIGVDPGVVLPPIGPDPRPEDGSEWGLGDIMLQYFFSPKATEGYKWGIGPQVSLKTRTSERQAGAGWGGGLAAVIFGGTETWAVGSIASQVWGQDDFNQLAVQNILLYNFESHPGVYLGYNNSLTYNWNADSGEKLTLPIGLTVGRTLLLGNGDGLDLSVGAYDLVERPEEGPEWQFKFGISYFYN